VPFETLFFCLLWHPGALLMSWRPKSVHTDGGTAKLRGFSGWEPDTDLRFLGVQTSQRDSEDEDDASDSFSDEEVSDALVFQGCDMLEFDPDLAKHGDAELLAMLSEIASGATVPTKANDDVSSTNVSHLSEEESSVRPSLDEWKSIAALRTQVRMQTDAKESLQSRLLGELQQLQERSNRQYQVTSVLVQRLAGAKQTLATHLMDASCKQQDIRARINIEAQEMKQLRERLRRGACAKVDGTRQLQQISDEQSSLVCELHAASDSLASVQSELRAERRLTWSVSVDAMMQFAQRRTPDPHGMLTVSALGSDRRFADLHQRCWTEGREMLRVGVRGSDEQAELRLECLRRDQSILELERELKLEESKRSRLQELLQEAVSHAVRSGIFPRPRLMESDTARSANLDDLDPVAHVKYAENLRNAVVDAQHQFAEESAKARRVKDRCDREQSTLRESQEILECDMEDQQRWRTELVRADDRAQELCDEIDDVNFQRAEQQRAATDRIQQLRREVLDRRAELEQEEQENEDLRAELHSSRWNCRCRKRNPTVAEHKAVALANSHRVQSRGTSHVTGEETDLFDYHSDIDII